MIYFDELSATKEMEESQSFKNGYTKTDLFMYTKYLKYKKAIESGIDYENIKIYPPHNETPVAPCDNVVL